MEEDHQGGIEGIFGFSIPMGIDHLPSVDDYWSSRVETRSSITLLLQIGFLGGVSVISPGTCTLWTMMILLPEETPRKVRPLINHLSDKFATPSKDVAVDEAMIKFQGRSSLKQYMPAKPIKRGIKVWVLGDSSNGYFSRFDVYTGRKEDRQVGLGAHVVQTLTEDLKDKHHHVYFTFSLVISSLKIWRKMVSMVVGRLERTERNFLLA